MGTWTSRKGIVDLATAFRLIREREPSITLVAAGTGAGVEVVRNSFAVEDRPAVSVLPRLSNEALRSAMSESVLFVMPSHYEGFGMAFLEAMGAGLPVVGTPTGGMADVIRDGENGRLVPKRRPDLLASTILDLLSDRQSLPAMSLAAHDAASQYTWGRAARATKGVYDQLLDRPKASLTPRPL
jgi:glycosyltransferase involved in cell wall biosynthesis